MYRQLLVLLILAVVPQVCLAQVPIPRKQSVEENVSRRVNEVKDEKFWSLSTENDLYGGGTDQYYTSGGKITYNDVNVSVPPVIDEMAELIPTFDLNQTTSTYFTIGQNIFTPDDIEIAAPQPNDRPWAGFLYGSVGVTTVEANHIDDFELTLGVVGPAALGEQTQKAIHKYVSGSPQPQGWRNQLKNEPALILSYGRRWPVWAETVVGPVRFRVEPQVNVSLGNVYTYAGTGTTVTMGAKNSRLQDTPPRVRPAIPGTGYFDSPDDEFSWFVFAGLDGRAIGRNIFLDGNTFRSNADVDKKHFVVDGNVGLAFTYDDYRLAYTLNYRTKEFETQDNEAIFGSVTISTRF